MWQRCADSAWDGLIALHGGQSEVGRTWDRASRASASALAACTTATPCGGAIPRRRAPSPLRSRRRCLVLPRSCWWVVVADRLRCSLHNPAVVGASVNVRSDRASAEHSNAVTSCPCVMPVYTDTMRTYPLDQVGGVPRAQAAALLQRTSQHGKWPPYAAASRAGVVGTAQLQADKWGVERGGLCLGKNTFRMSLSWSPELRSDALAGGRA